MADRPVIKIYRASGLYIPIKQLEAQEVQKATDYFQYSFYNDKKCSRCEHLENRHDEEWCTPCDGFKGRLKTAKTVIKKGKTYLRLPAGGLKKTKQWLTAIGIDKDGYQIVNKFPEHTPFKRPIKFTATLKEFQEEAVQVMLKKKRGILSSPPRSGKTVMSAAAICRIGLKTLILAHQREWLINFMETFVGSEDGKVPAFTDCNRKRISLCQKVEDFEKYDICLATFAMFFGDHGKRKLKKIKSLFNVVCIDECFTEDHEVLTEFGFLPIQDLVKLQEKPRVLSFNHETNCTEFRPVISTLTKSVGRLCRVKIDGVSIVCTPTHRFWSVTRNAYVEAANLLPGETLLKGPTLTS